MIVAWFSVSSFGIGVIAGAVWEILLVALVVYEYEYRVHRDERRK